MPRTEPALRAGSHTGVENLKGKLIRLAKTAPDRIRWSITVDDASTWTRPWTFSMPLTMNDNETIQQYECHEGNYGLRNILSAARADEH